MKRKASGEMHPVYNRPIENEDRKELVNARAIERDLDDYISEMRNLTDMSDEEIFEFTVNDMGATGFEVSILAEKLGIN
jgi:t-SNARE complex subunit (syntaxin)